MDSTASLLMPVLMVAGATYLPVELVPVASVVSVPLANSMSSLIKSAAKIQFFSEIRKKFLGYTTNRTLILEPSNPVYGKFESYLLEHHISMFRDCNLSATKGDLRFSLNNALLVSPIEVQYRSAKIVISLVEEDKTETKKHRMKSQDSLGTECGLRLTTSHSLDILKEFVQETCLTQDRLSSQQLRIFNNTRSESTKHSFKTVSWEEMEIITNRNLNNTILDESVRSELVDDVKWFVDNEAWFNSKGLPYKRGYLLHGPPGTGKTSIIKALAVEYQLPIFAMDLASIKDNECLKQLVMQIAYLAKGSKYILTMEDVDRCYLFDRRQYGHKLTIECLLNVLDGITECYGRILFLTANKPFMIAQEAPALLRPGRIDKQVEISYVSLEQLKTMLHYYYHDDFSSIKAVPSNLSPADVIKIFQKYPNDASQVMSKFRNADSSRILSNELESQNFGRSNIKSIRRLRVNPQKRVSSMLRSVNRRLGRFDADKAKNERMKDRLEQRLARIKERQKRVKLQEKEKKARIVAKTKKQTRNRKIVSNKN